MRSTVLTVIATAIITLYTSYNYSTLGLFCTVAGFWILVVILECVWIIKYDSTLSGMFWEWQKNRPFWERALGASSFLIIGVYLFIHLLFEV